MTGREDAEHEILNGLLGEVAVKIEMNDALLVQRRAHIERCSHGQANAQQTLDQLLKQEEELRRDYTQWLNYLNSLPDQGSPSMRQKLTDMTRNMTGNTIEIRDLREIVRTWINAQQEAQIQLSMAEQAHKSLQQEHARIAEEITKA